MTEPVNILCMKWGDAYGPDYVNRLYGMIARHLRRPFRLVCFTDDPAGLRAEVEPLPLPPIHLPPSHAHLPWRKLSLFGRDLFGLRGTALFLDLDLVVTGPLDGFFEYPGRFCIIHNWTHPDRRVGNSSVYRFEIGADAYVLDRFHERPIEHWIATYRNSQTFLSDTISDLTFWPELWCRSFKKHCLGGRLRAWFRPARMPAGARILVFHGHPKPDEAIRGEWPGGWYKRMRPAPWLAEHWRE